jgi:hypothetical protein
MLQRVGWRKHFARDKPIARSIAGELRQRRQIGHVKPFQHGRQIGHVMPIAIYSKHPARINEDILLIIRHSRRNMEHRHKQAQHKGQRQ